jgi:hypothetical protein
MDGPGTPLPLGSVGDGMSSDYFTRMLRYTWLGLHGPQPSNWLFTGVPADPVTKDEQKIISDVVMDALPEGWLVTFEAGAPAGKTE